MDKTPQKSFFSSKRLLLITIIILFLLILLFRFFSYLILPKYPRSQKFIISVYRFVLNSFGRLIEVIIFLIAITLISRLILIAFNANQEAFFTDNLRTTNLKTLLDQTFYFLRIIGLIFLLGMLSLIFRWLSRKGQGTVVVPFVDTTGGKYNGKEIADSLVAELHRIKLKLILKQYTSQEISWEVCLSQLTTQLTKIKQSITEFEKLLGDPKFLKNKGLIEIALEDAKILFYFPNRYMRPTKIERILEILNDALKKSKP